MSEPPVLYPSGVVASRLAAGETYATAEQILLCSDLHQDTIHIPFWRINGKPVAILVRELSLVERDRVQRETDTVAQYCLTWQIACISPTFTPEQANALQDKHPLAIEQVAQYIWRRSQLNQDWIEYVVSAQTDAPAPQADADRGAAADPGTHPRARRMDRPSRAKVRTAPRGARADAG